MVGRDAGPSFAGGRSTALLEAESCALLLHLSFCTVIYTSWTWKGFSNNIVVAAVILVLFSFVVSFPVFMFLLLYLHSLDFQCFPGGRSLISLHTF